MVTFLRTALAFVLLACGMLAASDASAQGRIVGRYGDWQIRCERQVGAPSEECALIQNVEAQDRANVALTVIFIRTADRQAQILRVLAPLGVLLPSGLGLSIDDADVGLAGFVRCLASGCLAEVQLDAGLIERLQAGRNATFVIFLTPEEGIGIPISLTGFADGFAALENPPQETLETVAPSGPVESETEAVAPDRPFEQASFAADDEEIDDRTALDQLLEDELFPYVAGAAAGALLLIVLAIVLVARAGRRRRAAREAAAAAPPAARQSPRLAPGQPQRQVPREGGRERRASPPPMADDGTDETGPVPDAPEPPRASQRVPNGPREPRPARRPERG